MNEDTRYMHIIAGGDVNAARLFGLSLIAQCGKVFVPLKRPTLDQRDTPDCATCHSGLPHRLTIDPHIVYRCYDVNDRLVYVGCTWSPKQRIEQHRANSWWFPQVARTRFIVFPNKDYALYKEREAIGEENPRWNVKGRDRALWDVADYADYLHALKQNGASEKRLDKVREEAGRRYQVELDEIEVAA